MAKKFHSYGDQANRPAEEDMEALFHKLMSASLEQCTNKGNRKRQGYVMGAFRETLGSFDVTVSRKPEPEKDPYKLGYATGYAEFGETEWGEGCPFNEQTEPVEHAHWNLGLNHGRQAASMHEDQMRGDPDPATGTFAAVVVAIFILIAFAWQRGWF
jgi:hypothetical protein